MRMRSWMLIHWSGAVYRLDVFSIRELQYHRVTGSEGMTEDEEGWGKRGPRNTITGRISSDAARTALFIARKFLRFSVGISSTLRVCFSVFLSVFFFFFLLYPSASRRYIAKSQYIIFPAGMPLDQSAWHLAFQTAFAIATAAVFPSRRYRRSDYYERTKLSNRNGYPSALLPTENRELTLVIERYKIVPYWNILFSFH